MPVRVVITHNLADIPVYLTGLTEGPVKRAIARSIKRTFQGLRTQTAKEIRDRKLIDTRSLPLGEIKRRFMRERERTSPSAPISEMQGRIDFLNRHPSLFNFFAKRVAVGYGYGPRGCARANRFGVHVTVFGRTYKPGKKAFIPSGKRTIVERVGKGRYPLKTMYGPSFGTLIEGSGAQEELASGAETRYAREISSNLDYFLKAKR